MQRINVVGASGSGKSTFGAALAQRLQGTLVELDELFWRPGWQQTPNDEFRAAVDAALAVDCWVVCGNYNSRVRDIVWGRADTVVWLDYPLAAHLSPPLPPHLAPAYHARKSCGVAIANPGAASFSAATRSSYTRCRRTAAARSTTKPTSTAAAIAHLQILRFRHPRAAEAWLAAVPPVVTPSTT